MKDGQVTTINSDAVVFKGTLFRFGYPVLKKKKQQNFFFNVYYFFLIFFFLNVYLFLRQRARQSMNGGGAEREGDTESEAGSRL